MLMPDDAPQKDSKTGRFLPGNSGYGGRPQGSRNKLTESFWHDFHDAWLEHGPEALRRCAQDNPKDFCKIAAMLMPKELKSDVQVLNLFAQVQDFAEAYAIAKEHIGVKMIEDDSTSDSE